MVRAHRQLLLTFVVCEGFRKRRFTTISTISIKSDGKGKVVIGEWTIEGRVKGPGYSLDGQKIPPSLLSPTLLQKPFKLENWTQSDKSCECLRALSGGQKKRKKSTVQSSAFLPVEKLTFVELPQHVMLCRYKRSFVRLNWTAKRVIADHRLEVREKREAQKL